LRAGTRGPSLLEDFHLREKITHFDHERIPERVVHARGAAAHGVFQVYRPLTEYTKAHFLQDPAVQTPVFVRFSIVGGSRGAADTVRDVRGWATKFYTQQGNFDLVGNNMPVFFVQDGIKFPDFVHAVKPEPDSEMPQASSAHDSLWDFVSLAPETAHTIMWLMSDRAIPRSYATMEGFGVHTFRLVSEDGGSRLVKFHWKPAAGVHSLVWDEAQKISGQDPDFHRRSMWESIEAGIFPEYELGIQVIEEADADSFAFDLLDPTKLVPEEIVPVEIVGKMTLNRNPDNYFAETEQVAYHPGNLVPGIDVTNDPLLQARLFSYLDTQLTRLGGPNFHEIPINKAIAPVHNNQQDGMHRNTINTAKANYYPNSLSDGNPAPADPSEGYVHFPEAVEGMKTRERAAAFHDYFSQATLFFHSLSPVEQRHVVAALQFEVGKVKRLEVRERVVNEILANVDLALAEAVGPAVGVPGVARRPARDVSEPVDQRLASSPALSQLAAVGGSIAGRQVAILVEAGFDDDEIAGLRAALESEGATPVFISSSLGPVPGSRNSVEATKTFATAGSVLFDAVYVPGGAESVATLDAGGVAAQFLREAHGHYKAIGAAGEAVPFIRSVVEAAVQAQPSTTSGDAFAGVVLGDDGALPPDFIAALAAHRHWGRDETQQMGTVARP
jgi:catalase